MRILTWTIWSRNWSFFEIRASGTRTLAFNARQSLLEALTVLLLAVRLFALASEVLNHFQLTLWCRLARLFRTGCIQNIVLLRSDHLFLEGVFFAFLNFNSGHSNLILMWIAVVTAGAVAPLVAVESFGEALAVHLEALRLGALAGQGVLGTLVFQLDFGHFFLQAFVSGKGLLALSSMLLFEGWVLLLDVVLGVVEDVVFRHYRKLQLGLSLFSLLPLLFLIPFFQVLLHLLATLKFKFKTGYFVGSWTILAD